MAYSVGLVQPNMPAGPAQSNTFYLPYSVGLLWAQVMAADDLRSEFKLDYTVWSRLDLDAACDRLQSCDVVAFSTYVWNHQYNYELARRLKARNAEVITVFGGPEVAVSDPKLFAKNPFMDVVVQKEGELAFCEILRHIQDKSWRNIAGLLINDQGQVIDTGSAVRLEDPGGMASPYLMGVFDDLIQQRPDINWQATLETNRGCPYQCTFCDWGSLTYNKVKKFDLGRVLQEIEWIGRHCTGLFVADANFGMFVERDSQIIDHIIAVKKRYHRLDTLSITWAKNQRAEVADLVERLTQEIPDVATGLTVALQSLDDGVLEAIKRRNMQINNVSKVFAIGREKNLPVYAEMILGLPRETLQTWQENFYGLFAVGNHSSMTVHGCQLLENAEMNLTQRKEFDIQTRPLYTSNDATRESIEVVISTNTMDRQQMTQAVIWTSFIMATHVNAATNWLAQLAVKLAGISYRQYYDDLWIRVSNDHWCRQQLETIESAWQGWVDNPELDVQWPNPHYLNPISDLQGSQQYFYYLTYAMHHEQQWHKITDLGTESLAKWVDYPRLVRAARDFQWQTMLRYPDLDQYPRIIESQWDFYGYLTQAKSLDQSVHYRLEYADRQDISFQEFIAFLYYRRKRAFAHARISQQNLPEFLHN